MDVTTWMKLMLNGPDYLVVFLYPLLALGLIFVLAIHHFATQEDLTLN